VGLGSLAYGSWLLTVVVIAVAMVIKLRKAALRPVLSFLGGVAAPVLARMALCYAVVGSYYNHEIQGVPGVRVVARPRPVRPVAPLHVVYAADPPGVSRHTGAVGDRRCPRGRDHRRGRPADIAGPSTEEDRALLWSIGLTQALTVVFVWGIGYCTSRLSVALIPPMLFVAGWIFARIAAAGSRAWTGRVLAVASAVAVVGWTGLILTLS
jgi:hypothetical protein